MIMLFGPAGSGKSLQGKILAEKLGWRWLSAGQLLRETEDPEIQKVLRAGELVDRETVIKIMAEAMDEAEAAGEGAILDGYPREIGQAEWLVQNDLDRLDGAIILNVLPEELWKRILARGRSDDTEEIIKKRFRIFEQNICSISNLLNDNNVKITTVNGTGEIPEVTSRLLEAIDGILKRKEK